jgi:hypothetical protein
MAPDPSADGGGGRPGAGDRRRAALAPALLVLLALAQAALVFGHDLSAWKGGGFGMFSTLDHEGWRAVRLYVQDEGAKAPRRTPLPPSLRREVRRARILPTQGSLARLARAALAAHPGARAVRVEVRRTVFDPETLEPRSEPLAALRLEARGPR